MYVDVHNHIIPGIDDGARNMEESLDMARVAVADGTDTMIATPHRVWTTRRDAPPQWVRDHTTKLQEALNENGIPLRVLPGVEIPMGIQVWEQLAAGTLLTLGDTGKTALIEPPFDSIPDFALESLRNVRKAGFDIILAHPERNSKIQEDLTFLEHCCALGIVLQLTSGSLVGKFGRGPKQTAEAILCNAPRWQIVIASDTHDLERRTPGDMTRARNAAALIAGKAEAQEMVDGRPRRLLGL